MSDIQPITAIIAAYDREEATCGTIRNLLKCVPPPDEILVHMDNGAEFPVPEGVRILRSTSNIGPGGGRNRMVREARNEWIASFDDDSYPVDRDYFQRLGAVIVRHPDAGVIAAVIRHRNPVIDAPGLPDDAEVATFVGCGCVYHRETFLKTSGYVPLPVAYGMEEVDLALQLSALGSRIIESPNLIVYHDTGLIHHEKRHITAGSVMNQALLVWVRYPIRFWPLGMLQWLNKFRDNCGRGRWLGALEGLLRSPLHVWRHRRLRSAVPSGKMADWLQLRRKPRIHFSLPLS